MDALAIGLSRSDFWSLSLRELWNEHKAAAQRMKREHERDLILAWQVQRVEIMSMQTDGGRKLPNLKMLLNNGRVTPQTPNEMVHVLHTLSAQYGLKLTAKKASDGEHHPDHG